MMLDQAPSVPASQQSFLAFDFGLKRTGVAVGNRMLKQATPQATVVAEGDARFALIEKRIKEWTPDALVVGVPFHPDAQRTKIHCVHKNLPANCAAALD